jgi:hypothetical protein
MNHTTKLIVSEINGLKIHRFDKIKANQSSINLWIAELNLKIGAAINVVQVAKLLVKRKYLTK